MGSQFRQRKFGFSGLDWLWRRWRRSARFWRVGSYHPYRKLRRVIEEGRVHIDAFARIPVVAGSNDQAIDRVLDFVVPGNTGPHERNIS